jgi:hypothetical protein
MWTGIFLLVALLARGAGADRRTLLRGLGIVFALLAVTALAGGAGRRGALQRGAARLPGRPGGRRSAPPGSPAATLAACGFLGLVLSYRRPFHIGDSAYVGLPLLFALISAAGLLHAAVATRRLAGTPTLRRRAAMGGRRARPACVCGRLWQYASIEAVPAAGTAGMLSAGPDTAHELE